MSKPTSPQNKPYLVELEANTSYYWCSCGLSKRQPFCDGAHKKTDFRPVRFIVDTLEDALLCGCKHTLSPPYCDGAHNNLEDEYEVASDAEISATAHLKLTPREHGTWGKAPLDGGCYVYTSNANLPNRLHPTISADDGAHFLCQFEFRAPAEYSNHYQFEESDTALFVLDGSGTLNISGNDVALSKHMGALVPKGESFCVKANPDSPLELVVSVCPLVREPAVSTSPAADTNSLDINELIREIDTGNRESMADRFYQVLIGEPQDKTQLTQFIGELPISRAAAHRHLYEETLVILSGHGFMWTENAKAEVRAGDTIFLPAKQLHSLECCDPNGMMLMGVFYPSGSPAVNYR
jgi:CDGSH-type Zn-finger protein/quercetin dioxygenase-like cupin family protein